MTGENRFNIFTWSSEIPFCMDDVWLGMQARNIAVVDLTIIREIEGQALAAYMERERTPSDILLPLSALSQMWVFSLYEFLRTWRQRARAIVRIHQAGYELSEEKRDDYFKQQVESAKAKEGHVKFALALPSDFVAKASDEEFIRSVENYRDKTEGLFHEAEALRVTLAKHEIPKTKGFVAEAPGYGRMEYLNGSMYWFIVLNDGSQLKVCRRELADMFFGFDVDEV
ncbi:MAG: hypothetical protein WBO09_16100 [Methylocystis silviterrae]|uniref:hypothetical protein n=1 Tax=Methylocystis silviterrae TaxID=2743612 RepID=UPI003C722C8C